MAKKRSDLPNSEPLEQEDASLPPMEMGGSEAPGNDGTSDDSVPSSTPRSKTEAVKLALEAGVKPPKDIVEYVKDQFQMDMTTAHVSTIKGNLKRGGSAQPKKKPGRKPKR